MTALDRYFAISARQSTVGREVRGGVTTFLTMAYVLLVNPSILANAGMNPAAVATSTALAAGLCSILMGVWANFPLGLASGMGVNAIVAFTLVRQTGSWQTAMGLVVIDGGVVVLLVLAGLREKVLEAIPRDLRVAIGVGIGLFIALIGLENAKLIVADPVTLVTHANLNPHQPHATLFPPLIALAGLAVIAVLMTRKITGAILIGVAFCTLAALELGVAHVPATFPRPAFGTMFHADVAGAFKWQFASLVMALVLIDFFDTLGTATAVGDEGGLTTPDGRLPGVRRILLVDGVAASVGGLLGASSVTAYIESAAGVAEGARTGLHSIVVGVLFLLAIAVAAAGRCHSGVRDRAGPHSRRLPDDDARRRHQIPQLRDSHPGVPDDPDHSADVFYRPRHRVRADRASRSLRLQRQRPAGALGAVRGGGGVRVVLRHRRVIRGYRGPSAHGR